MGKETILVIEDNTFNMKLVRTLLQFGEYHVLEASAAEVGIELARERRPDLILMDLQLHGTDGLEAARLIQQDPALKGIPMIALTAFAMKEDAEKSLDAGCVGYITKPINSRTFLDTVKELKSGKPSAAPKSDGAHKHRILVVDDDPVNTKLLTSMLQTEKYHVITAYNGKGGLEKTYQEHPDLILLDIMMPDIDGYEVTRRLKNDPKTGHIPIMLVTALDGKEDKKRGLESGADEFLNKPINLSELRARVQSLLRLKVYQEQLNTRTQSQEFMLKPVGSDAPAEETILSPSILLVENDANEAQLFEQYLAQGTVRLKVVGDGEEALAFAESEPVDLILMDVLLPGIDGFQVIERLKKTSEHKNVQVVVVTSLDGRDDKIRGIDLGVDDYLIKPVNREELTARVKALLKKKAYMDRLSNQYESALQAAISDKMTGIYNHAYFKHFLNLEIKRSMRQKHPLALIMIDIDDFKKYNDTHGHVAGDKLLQWLAQILKKCVREVDLSARYGGEEFAVVLPYADRKGAPIVAERIQEAIRTEPFEPAKAAITGKTTVSMGVAYYPEDASSAEELVKMADSALYRAKKEGKNRICIFDKNLFDSETQNEGAAPKPSPASEDELNKSSEIRKYERRRQPNPQI